MKFTYRCGQQPLAGYTIKRGIGWGGFGEVYFAVSEGGKEVALKWVRSNLDVELRGVQQCLNLKHANLVHLYDLRHDAVGSPWLVMEYVSGESLSAIIHRHPNGIPVELAAEWFQGIASAVHHLHEHGIVHRDLKPGNIFLEAGVIKVGDYGLCRLMGGSQHAGLTQNVGTVHYMAPEISTGNYNRHVDIYAAGVVLFEMLTGRLPFDGESAGEIMMKHLTSSPNLSRLPPEFMPILERALAKNPAHRFQSMAEFGKKVGALTQSAKASPAPSAEPREEIPMVHLLEPGEMTTRDRSRRFREMSGMLVGSVMVAALFSAAWTLFFRGANWEPLVKMFFVATAASWAVILPTAIWSTLKLDDSWSRRLIMMCCGFAVGLFALWLDGYELPLPWSAGQVDALQAWVPPDLPEDGHRPRSFFTSIYSEPSSMPLLASYLGYFGLTFLVLRWWKSTEITRWKRFSLKPLIATGFWAYVLLFLLPGVEQRHTAFISLVMASAAVQLVSPWRERPPAPIKKRRLHAQRVGRLAV